MSWLSSLAGAGSALVSRLLSSPSGAPPQVLNAMHTITASQVRGLAQYLSQVYKTSYRTKATSIEMVGAAAVLDALGVIDASTFLSQYSTTIGRTIFLPFEPGEQTQVASLWGQVRILTHEHQHVVQMDRDGTNLFAAGYLGDRDKRAEYEAEAYSTAFELNHWAGLALDQPEQLASTLGAYGLTRAQIDYAAGIMRSNRATVESGGRLLECHAAATAVDWLRANT